MSKSTVEEVIKFRPGAATYVVFCLIFSFPIYITTSAMLEMGFRRDDVQAFIIILVLFALLMAWFHAHQITLEPSRLLYKRPLLGTTKIDIVNIQKVEYIRFSSKSPAMRLAIKHDTGGEKQVTVINTKLFSRKNIRILMDKIHSSRPETTKTVSWT